MKTLSFSRSWALAFFSRSGALILMFGGSGAMAKTPDAATSRVSGAKKFGLTASNVAADAPASFDDGPRVGEGMATRRIASDRSWLIVVVMSVCASTGSAMRERKAKQAARGARRTVA